LQRTTVVVGQAEGLHARPAAEFVKLASRFRAAVRLARGGREADGKSIMAVMALGASRGAEVELRVEGEDEAEAFSALRAFLEGGGA
jgi:phosphocarrier protein HPr